MSRYSRSSSSNSGCLVFLGIVIVGFVAWLETLWAKYLVNTIWHKEHSQWLYLAAFVLCGLILPKGLKTLPGIALLPMQLYVWFVL